MIHANYSGKQAALTNRGGRRRLKISAEEKEWEKIGAACELYVAPMAPHAFKTLVPNSTITRELFDSARRFLSDVLAIDKSE